MSLPTGHPVDLDAGEADLAAGRWQPAEVPGVSSGEHPLRGHPLVGYGVLHLEVQVGEAREKSAEELNPRVAVEEVVPSVVEVRGGGPVMVS